MKEKVYSIQEIINLPFSNKEQMYFEEYLILKEEYFAKKTALQYAERISETCIPSNTTKEEIIQQHKDALEDKKKQLITIISWFSPISREKLLYLILDL